MNVDRQNRGDLLLQKWLNGTINWQEERELEQLAKGDAMLADALEGVQTLPESDHVQRVKNLKIRLQKHTNSKPRGLIFYLPRVAAAAAIIATLAFGIRYFVENEELRPEVAIIEQREQRTESREQRVENRELKTEIATPDETLVFEDKKENRSTSRKIIAAPKTPPAENTRVEPLADTNFTITETDASSIAAEEKPEVTQMERSKTSAVSPQLQKPSAARSITPSTIFLPERIIIGKLTDAQGEPLVGGTVAANGTDRGTTTGLNGDFTLPVTPDMKELVFSYTGFETTAIAIGKNDTVRVQLKENAQSLSEVLVSDYANKKQKIPPVQQTGADTNSNQMRMRSERSLDRNPQPSGGFEKFNQYIQKNLRYPKAAQKAKVEGEVGVVFQILPSGKLTDFKIVKSLGYGCDEEAIRLLRGGPKWDVADPTLGKNGGCVIEFKLKN